MKYETLSLIIDLFDLLCKKHIKKKKVTNCGYSTLKKDSHSSTRATTGVALLVLNDFPHDPILLNTNIQAIAVQIHIRQLITSCAIYLPPNDALC